MRVSDNAENGDEIDSKAEIVSSKGKEYTNNVRINVGNNEDVANTQAASIFGSNSSFLPLIISVYIFNYLNLYKFNILGEI